MRIFSDSYRNEVSSSDNLAKGYTRSIVHGTTFRFPDDTRKAHDKPMAKKSLNVLLCSNAVRDKSVKVGDTVNIHTKQQNQTCNYWSPARPGIKSEPSCQTVTLPEV